MTIVDDEGLSCKHERALRRYGCGSYGIQEFARRTGSGTSKLVLAALMASLGRPDVKDSPRYL